MKIAVTGHRPDKLGFDYDLSTPFCQEIKRVLILLARHDNIQFGISGMALGVDTLWAEALVFDLNVPLVAAIPFLEQSSVWQQSSKTHYANLLDRAYKVVNVSGQKKYKEYFMHQRNKWMVDNCDMLYAVWNGDQRGGTFNCIQYAKSVNKPIRFINIDIQSKLVLYNKIAST